LKRGITNGLPRSFYVISIGAFLFQLTNFMIQPVFTLYILDLGASIFQVGLILSLQSFLMIVSRVPLTLLAEKIGKNRMLSVTFIVQATAQILYFLAPSPLWLYFIPLYGIVARGLFNQLAMSMASNMAPSTRQGDALGRYMTFFSMGLFIGPVITSILVASVSYRQLFLVAALFPAMGEVLFLRYATRGDWNRAPEPRRRPRSSETSSLKAVLRERNVLILTVIRTAYAISNTMFNTLFAIYAVDQLGFSPSLVALLFSAVGFANTLIKLPAGRISDRVGRKNLLLVAFGVIVIDYVAIAYARNIIPLAVSLIVFGACWGTRAVTEWSFLASTVPPETKTLAMSYLSTFWGLGSTVGSMIAGISAGVLPFPTIFLLAAIINIPAIPSIYAMKNPKDTT